MASGASKPPAAASSALQQALQAGLKVTKAPLPTSDALDNAQLKHGELLIAKQGLRIKYLLVPAAKAFDSNLILKTILSPELWGLAQPNLTVQPMGPKDYWQLSVESIADEKEKLKWGKDQDARLSKFESVVNRLGSNILQAIIESGGWMFSTCAGYSSHDHAGVVFEKAVSHFRRENPNTNLVYMAAKPLSQFVGPVNEGKDFDPQKPFTLLFPDKLDLAECAVPVGETVKEQVVYPWVRDFVYPTKEDPGAAICAVPHFVTHLIIIDNVSQGYPDVSSAYGDCRPDMALESLVTTSMPHASVIIGGKAKSRVFDYSADLAHRGSTIIALENTGYWVDHLCKAVRRMRDPKAAKNSAATDDSMEKHDLPLDTDHQKYLLFDALTTDPETIVSRLTKTLTAIRSGESNELGFAANERSRLREAWLLHAKLEYNADKQRRIAFCLQGVINWLAIGTTLAVILTEVFDKKSDRIRPYFPYISGACSVLPLVSSFVQSLMGAFSPVSKFAYMALGAEQVKSSIYKYRARVGQFSPLPKEVQVQSALERKGGKKPRPKGSQAQANFSAALEAIQISALSNMKDGSLESPPAHIFETKKRQAREEGAVPLLEVSDVETGNGNKQPTIIDDLGDNAYSLVGAVVREDDKSYDDFGSLLTGEDYILFRTLPLQSKYRQRAVELQRQASFFQYIVFLSTLAAAILSIFDLKSWVPLAVSISASASSWLEFAKYKTRLSNCNQAWMQLDALQRWWGSLSFVQRRTPACKETLVEQTELNADAEEAVWARSSQPTKKKDDEQTDKDIGEQEDK